MERDVFQVARERADSRRFGRLSHAKRLGMLGIQRTGGGVLHFGPMGGLAVQPIDGDQEDIHFTELVRVLAMV